jgi:hypothetical protein
MSLKVLVWYRTVSSLTVSIPKSQSLATLTLVDKIRINRETNGCMKFMSLCLSSKIFSSIKGINWSSTSFLV